MTDPARDELLAAVLDGTATPDDVARVEADPELAARLASMRSTAAALGDIAAPAGLLDTQIAAALDAFEPAEQGADDTAPVVSLAERRRSPRFLAAAAAVAALALVGSAFVALSDDGGDADSFATGAIENDDAGSDGGDEALDRDFDEDAAEAESAPAADSLEDAPGGGAGDDTATETSEPAALGGAEGDFRASAYVVGEDFDARTTDDVFDVVRERLAAAEERAASSREWSARPDCPTYADVAASFDEVNYEGPATVDGREVVVLAGSTSDGTEVYVFDAGSCEVLANGRL